MKTFLKNISLSFLMGFIMFLGFAISGIIYASWTIPIKAISGDNLTSDLWNKTQDNIDYLRGRVDGGVTVPSGAILSFNLKECPTGWLPANGSGSIAGESIPDLRGEFIRGLDNGRGIDNGRSLGSNQLDAVEEFKIMQQTSENPLNPYSTSNYYNTAGASSSDRLISLELTRNGPRLLRPYKLDGSGLISQSDETRPRNIALLYCIKE